jgi:predicted AAA+ superfamily ATPase
MIRRYLEGAILESLRHFPAVLLTGARQVGKSTLAQSLIASTWKASYFTLDDRTTLDAALRDPDGLIGGMPTPAVIDEVQKAPDLMRAIKKEVDRNRLPGRYLLTGSANVLALAKVSETLAGRVILHTLFPFSWPEILERPQPAALNALFQASTAKEFIGRLPKTSRSSGKDQLIQRILAGGYPIPALLPASKSREEWFSSYRQTYLERDLLTIKSIENIPDFNRLLTLAAFRTGRLLNLSDFSRETGLPFTTLRRYMNLLEVTYQVFYLRPYYTHVGKRLVKTPKLYFSDTGMASYLLGAHDWPALENQGQAGFFVETWVASELLKLMPLADHRLKLYFWRTQAGQEVDFMIERGKEIVALEVKWGRRIEEGDIRNMRRCAEELKDRLHLSVFLYGGSEVLALTENMVAIPFPTFFGIDNK